MFGFFVVLAATLNSGFPVLGYAGLSSTEGTTSATTTVVVSLSGGALLADLVSVTILHVDLLSARRR